MPAPVLCPILPERLRLLYSEEKLTDSEIVSILKAEGHDPATTVKRVRSWRKRFGIPTLERWKRNSVTPIEGRLESLLIGSMLGDGRVTAHATAPRYTENHCAAQRSYLEWKAEMWGPQWGRQGVVPVQWGDNAGFRFHTVGYSTLLPWRDLFYDNRIKGWKRLIPEVIDLVDPLALAIWYLDDGCCAWWPVITFGAGAPSVEVARGIFDKFDLSPRWALQTETTGCFHFEREDTAHRFIEIISPHVPDCMAYKLTGFGFQGAHFKVRRKLTAEILRPLAEAGMPIRQIARELGVGATTVGRYLTKFEIDHPRLKGNPLHRI